MHIVLYEPQIPQNTGNIVRTCKATNSKLTLIKPLGFSLNERHLKRAGLDYFEEVNIEVADSLEEVIENNREKPAFFFSSKVSKPYTQADLTKEALLIFGSETSGLPQKYFDLYMQNFYTIPMSSKARCLNLSNSVAIAIYEAMRQQNWQSLILSN